jgi:PKD repeat protein
MARWPIVVAVGVVLGLIAAPLALGAPGDAKKLKACFTQSPSAPMTGETVTFSSDCSSPGGSIAERDWDFDADGSIDAKGASATRAWPAPGDYKVRLVVVGDSGAKAETTATVTVANRAPVATFSSTPAEPVVGQPVKLTSTSSDADGTLASQSWDLDNDGAFDDASGPSASFTPTAGGTYPVALRVVDDRGAATTASKTFVVAQPPQPDPPPATPPGSPPPPAQQPSAPAGQFDDSLPTSPGPTAPAAPPQLRWLEPFPVVRIRGQATRSGVLLNLLTVRAPSGARVELRCAGRSCAKHRVRKPVKASSGKPGTVRFDEIEGRLRAGTRLQVLVTQKGLVGKYTRFRIRRMRPPVRTDRCLMPNSTRPVACPAPQSG